MATIREVLERLKGTYSSLKWNTDTLSPEELKDHLFLSYNERFKKRELKWMTEVGPDVYFVSETAKWSGLRLGDFLFHPIFNKEGSKTVNKVTEVLVGLGVYKIGVPVIYKSTTPVGFSMGISELYEAGWKVEGVVTRKISSKNSLTYYIFSHE